jgi:hypothetical protein
VFQETKGSLSLIFLFNKHCANKGVLKQKDFDLYAEYKEFADQYTTDNLAKHIQWVSQNETIKTLPGAIEELKELMMFLDLDIQYNGPFSTTLLDARYGFMTKDRFIKSINPLISKMLRGRYWTPNMIEKFVNTHGSSLTGSTFGGIFQYYMIAKIQELNTRRIPLQIKLKEITFAFKFDRTSEVKYGWSFSKKSKIDGPPHEIITFMIKNNKSTLYKTPQQTFPLFDILVVNKENEVALMINLKKNRISNDVSKTESSYLENYVKQIKEQLSLIIYF